MPCVLHAVETLMYLGCEVGCTYRNGGCSGHTQGNPYVTNTQEHSHFFNYPHPKGKALYQCLLVSFLKP